MPTCPGCGLSVTYEELRFHLGTCRFVWSEAPRQTDRLTEHLARQIRRLEERLQRTDRSQSERGTSATERASEEDEMDRNRRSRNRQ